MASEQITRAIDILLFLYGKHATVREIQSHLCNIKGHHFSNDDNAKRAIQRTLKQLEDYYGLSRDDSGVGVPARWTVDTTQFEKLLSLDESLALAMVIAEQQVIEVAEPLISKSVSNLFERAKAQLAVNKRASSKWRERVKVKSASHRLERPKLCEKMFEDVLSAALEQEGLRFHYRRAHDMQAEELECRALAIFYRGPQAYLIARMPDNNIRRFPLTRMSNVRRSLLCAIEVGDFDLDEYDARGELGYLNTKRLPELGESFQLTAEVFISVVREIEYAPLGERQKITPIAERQGYYLLEVNVPNTLHLAQWVLARAPYLRVITPTPFAHYLESELRQALQHIENGKLDVPKLN